MAIGVSFDLLFNPRSIAIIGDRRENNFYWARALLRADFKGRVYYVNTAVDQAMGQKFYKSLLDVEDEVDYVIISVPARVVPHIVSDCAEKGVKFATIFSSGFSELGSEDGKKLEEETLRAARGKVRLIGPNCMGVYCPRSGLAFRLDQPRITGSVAFISQSGGLSNNFTLSGWRHGIHFSKVISYGNSVDVGDAELLDYLADDPETSIIAAYLEGTKNGVKLANALIRASSIKPVVVWKGGTTGSGAKAVSSHTGSLAGSPSVWEGVMRQSKVIGVSSFEELIGTTKVLLFSPPPHGRNVGLISISGGSSVVNTDTVVRYGLRVPRLGEETKNALSSVVEGVGTSMSNPIDMGSSFYDPNILRAVVFRIGEDPNIDSLIVEIAPLYVVGHGRNVGDYNLPSRSWRNLLMTVSQVEAKTGKPVVVSIVDVAYEKESRKLEKMLTKNTIPCYPSVGRAAEALANYAKYYEAKQHQATWNSV
jgi:acyl-CoA synthetase (NDP forming)